jgi:hypothetical protein
MIDASTKSSPDVNHLMRRCGVDFESDRVTKENFTKLLPAVMAETVEDGYVTGQLYDEQDVPINNSLHGNE